MAFKNLNEVGGDKPNEEVANVGAYGFRVYYPYPAINMRQC